MVEHNQSQYYGNQYKFNGKELDAATGMYYYGARYYDPRLSIFISVDPLAEKFMGWTPYHYVHQNPINLIDPTGMSAEGPGDPPDEEATELPEIVINFTREQVTPKNTTDVSKFNPSNSIPCVECHHKTSVPNGSISKPNGAVFWGDNATSFKAPNYGVGRDIESINIQFMIDLSDVFSPEVSDRLEKASELFKEIDFSPKSNASNSTKVNYQLYKYIIASTGYSDYVKAYPVFVKDTAVFPKDVSTLNIHKQMDSMSKLPEVKRYNDSVHLSIINRFKK